MSQHPAMGREASFAVSGTVAPLSFMLWLVSLLSICSFQCFTLCLLISVTIVHQSTSDGNLSAGAIAGIVFAAIIVVFLVVVVAYVLYKKVCMRRQTGKFR